MKGLITVLARFLEPLFIRLMPDVPRGHASHGSITMNVAANMLGLDNAATPMGLKAMQDLQQLNPDKDRASNAQILFLVLNTSSVTLLPVTIFMYRAQQGAADPTAVFIPILMATIFTVSRSAYAGLFILAVMVFIVRKFNNNKKIILASVFVLIITVILFSLIRIDIYNQGLEEKGDGQSYRPL